MFRIDDPTAATSLPVPESAGTEGYFTEGDPVAGTPATLVRGSFLNMVQEELRTVVTAGGLTPSKTTYNQVLAAIRAIGKQTVVLTDTGATNAYAAANVPPLVSGTWVNGVVQQVLIAHTNTGASTYAPDGLSAIPIYGLGLTPLQGNEMPLNSTAILMKATIPGVNSGNPICVLMECAGGTQQVAQATASNQAPQISQIPGKNKIIDGRFVVNQKGYVSGTAVAIGGYAFDMWKSSTSSSSMTFTTAPQGQSVTIVGSFQQVVERVNVIAGYYTLSWVGSSQARVYNSGSGAPSYASSPLIVLLDGTQNVVVEFNAGTVINVQLEYGGIATTYESRFPAAEVVLAQRYLYAVNVTGVVGSFGGTGTYVSLSVFAPVSMRGTPTITLGTAMTVGKSGVATSTTTNATASISSATSNNISFNVNGNWGAGLSAGDCVVVTSTTGLAYFDARL